MITRRLFNAAAAMLPFGKLAKAESVTKSECPGIGRPFIGGSLIAPEAILKFGRDEFEITALSLGYSQELTRQPDGTLLTGELSGDFRFHEIKGDPAAIRAMEFVLCRPAGYYDLELHAAPDKYTLKRVWLTELRGLGWAGRFSGIETFDRGIPDTPED